ncbi:MAG: hypothetical protein HUU08_11470 [Candidatus Brocadia sp.]|nr:hypothetical protein [Candidatus Brocadia sp.]
MKDYTKGKDPDMLEPFFPNELFRHIIAACFLFVLELIAVILFPLPALVDKPGHVAWFLLPVYLLNKIIQNEVIFISILVLCALLFVLWPFLGGSKRRGSSANCVENINHRDT